MVALGPKIDDATLASTLSEKMSCAVLLCQKVECFLLAEGGTPERSYRFLFDCLRLESFPTGPDGTGVVGSGMEDGMFRAPCLGEHE